jgi:hypothetical protein
VFAVDFSLSAGAGGLLGYNFTRYTLTGEVGFGDGIGDRIHSVQSMDRLNYGAFLFFDATYGELTVMLQGGYNTWTESMDYTGRNAAAVSLSRDKGTGREMSVGFSLMGKYPFVITEAITWFPLLGLEYHIALREWRQPEDDLVYDRTKGELNADRDKDGNSYPLSAWNSLWINLGAGLDYSISRSLYLRGELLFGFRLQTVYETGALEMTKSMFNVPNPKLVGLTGGPWIKICLGYRFYSK